MRRLSYAIPPSRGSTDIVAEKYGRWKSVRAVRTASGFPASRLKK